jgi:adenosylcobinamide-GDP ribazoletransferase
MAWGSDGRDGFGLGRQLAVALTFLTRLPVRLEGALPEDAVARAAWAFPLAGVVVGLISGAVGVLALRIGLPPAISGVLALGAGILATGALHEDGLADTADGFGGGATPVRKLEIMKDSRIGSYGVLALLIVLGLRAVALADLARAGGGVLAGSLVAAHAVARAGLPEMMRRLPSARPDGLAAAVGRPEAGTALGALGIGFLAAWMGLGFGRGIEACILAAIAMTLVGLLARRQIGGYTGDVLGAAQQVGETVVLLAVLHGFTALRGWA